MKPVQSFWSNVCNRLGVQPKQFAVLAGSGGAASCILAAKWFLVPAAAVAAPAVAAPTATLASSAPAPKFLNGTPEQLDMTLETHPARDPFWSEPAPLSHMARVEFPEPVLQERPNGIKLQATVDQALAVFDGVTVRIGDSVVDKSGRSFRLSAVSERQASLTDGTQLWIVGFSP